MDGTFCRSDVCVPVGPTSTNRILCWDLKDSHDPDILFRGYGELRLCAAITHVVVSSINRRTVIIGSSKLWSFRKIGRMNTLACGRRRRTAEDQTGGGATEVSRPLPHKGSMTPMTPGKFKIPLSAFQCIWKLSKCCCVDKRDDAYTLRSQ